VGEGRGDGSGSVGEGRGDGIGSVGDGSGDGGGSVGEGRGDGIGSVGEGSGDGSGSVGDGLIEGSGGTSDKEAGDALTLRADAVAANVSHATRQLATITIRDTPSVNLVSLSKEQRRLRGHYWFTNLKKSMVTTGAGGSSPPRRTTRAFRLGGGLFRCIERAEGLQRGSRRRFVA
jgi:hypothetical protein